MITVNTLDVQPGDTVRKWSTMAVDRPLPPRHCPGDGWVFIGYQRCAPTSNFKTYYFGCVIKPERDEYSVEWLMSLECAA